MAKWLSVRLRTKWLWVQILFLSLKQEAIKLSSNVGIKTHLSKIPLVDPFLV